MFGLISLQETIQVSGEEAKELSSVFQNDDIHRICHRLLVNHLFSNPLQVKVIRKHESLELPKKEDLEHIVRKYYGATARQAFEDLLIYGYTYFVKAQAREPILGDRVVEYPGRVHNADGMLESKLDEDGIRRFHSSFRNAQFSFTEMGPDGKPKKDLYVYMSPTNYPDEYTGKHKSIVAASLTHSIYVSQLYSLQIQAHTQRSKPPLIVQQTKQTSSHDTNWAAISRQNPSLLGASHDMKEVEVHYLKRGAEMMDNMYASTAGNEYMFSGVHGARPKVTKYTPSAISQRVYIPPGYEVATQGQLPEAQSDLLAYDADRKEHLMNLYGIPPSLALSGARNSSKTSTNIVDDNDILLLGRTLKAYQDMIIDMITTAHMTIFPELGGRSDLEFSLPLVPFISIQRVLDLVDRDVIPTDIGKRYIADIAGIDRKDILLDGENKHTRPPVGGNENQTTQLMKAKEEVMKAEAAKLRAETEAIKKGEPGEDIAGQGELMDKEMELKETEIEGKLQVMEAQKSLIQMKTKADLAKMKAQVAVNRSAPKKPAASS